MQTRPIRREEAALYQTDFLKLEKHYTRSGVRNLWAIDGRIKKNYFCHRRQKIFTEKRNGNYQKFTSRNSEREIIMT